MLITCVLQIQNFMEACSFQGRICLFQKCKFLSLFKALRVLDLKDNKLRISGEVLSEYWKFTNLNFILLSIKTNQSFIDYGSRHGNRGYKCGQVSCMIIVAVCPDHCLNVLNNFFACEHLEIKKNKKMSHCSVTQLSWQLMQLQSNGPLPRGARMSPLLLASVGVTRKTFK